MITIVDYGMGNLRSVQKAFELFYRDVRISSSPKEVLSSNKVVLPGVGAFSKAMEELQKRDLIGPVKEVIKKRIPFLGICLGLQLLFSESEEGGRVKGLAVLKGKVKRFEDKDDFKIPHMGWNKILQEKPLQAAGILAGVPDESYMYFVHSYFVEPEDKAIILCKTDYIRNFTSGIHRKNIYAFQFHPEKSQRLGLRIIKNFVEL